MELQEFIVDTSYFDELDLYYWPIIYKKLKKGLPVYKNDPDLIGFLNEIKREANLDIKYILSPAGPTFLITNAVCFTMMGAELKRKGYLYNVR